MKTDIKPDELKDMSANNKTIIECHISYLHIKHLNYKKETNKEKINENIQLLKDYKNI